MTAPLAEQVAAALRGHSLDTMSQDSGKHCKCGSDSRFEQWDGDRPWKSMDEHRADAVLRVVAEWLGSEEAREIAAVAFVGEMGTTSPLRVADATTAALRSALGPAGSPTRPPDAPDAPAPVSADPRGAEGGSEGRGEGGAL